MALKPNLVEGKLPFRAGERPAPEWNTFPDLVEAEFDVLVNQYRQAHTDETAAKKVKDELKGDIQALLIGVGQGSLRVGELQAVICHGRSGTSIDAELLSRKLVELGVDADVVAQAVEESTTGGKSYDYIQVVEVKGQ